MKYPERPVLLIDDEKSILATMRAALLLHGISNVREISDSRDARAVLDAEGASAIILDLMMPHPSGDELISQFAESHPDVPIIVVTGADDVERAVQSMRNGAFDYLVKAVESEKLVASLRHALEIRELRQENTLLRDSLSDPKLDRPEAFAAIVTESRRMRGLFSYVESISRSPAPILITGETGVGKELLARAIHAAGGRPGNFVAANVAGLDDALFSDTLFGHRRGAFTGASDDRAGLVSSAADGTLFLDEIGDLDVQSQVKLLRLLENGEYTPLGADRPSHTTARILAATNRDLAAAMRDGHFRPDLYYRLESYHVSIPPLRERPDDIRPLTHLFLAQAAAELGKPAPTPPGELFSLLRGYHFPGNVRELRSLVRRAVSHHTKGVLSLNVFKAAVLPNGDRAPAGWAATSNSSTTRGTQISFPQDLPTLREAADLLVDEAMRRSEGNQSLAAAYLGITPQALGRRLKKRREATE